MQIKNEAIELFLPELSTAKYTCLAANIYKYTNQKDFQNFSTSSLYKPVLSELFKAHNQSPLINYEHELPPNFIKNNKVLLCCSGGLDSVYQALYLKPNFDVILLHLANANAYTNAQEEKAFIDFAEKFNFKYIMPKISAKHNTEYKKYWQENSFKNFLIYSIAVDYMLEYGIHFLSSGDDLRLSIINQAVGVNTGDCRELTEAFLKAFNISFLPVDSTVHKAKRLAFLDKFGARDYYNSCVGPGRLIRIQNERYSHKFNQHLDKWNCCSCRKCCMHILLDHYYNSIQVSKELEERCWEILGNKKSADFVFFDTKLPLSVRINNLINY